MYSRVYNDTIWREICMIEAGRAALVGWVEQRTAGSVSFHLAPALPALL